MISSENKYLRINSTELYTYLKNKSEHEISLTGTTRSYCVGLVDIVNSTSVTARLTNAKICEYYCIFLNSMQRIAKAHVVIVKNLGDILPYYFPATEDALNIQSFTDVLEWVSSHDRNTRYRESNNVRA